MADPIVFHVEEIAGYTCVYQTGNPVKKWGITLQSIMVHADDGIGYCVEYVLFPFANRFVAAFAIPILRARATRYLQALTKDDHGEETQGGEGEDRSGSSA